MHYLATQSASYIHKCEQTLLIIILALWNFPFVKTTKLDKNISDHTSLSQEKSKNHDGFEITYALKSDFILKWPFITFLPYFTKFQNFLNSTSFSHYGVGQIKRVFTSFHQLAKADLVIIPTLHPL